MIYDKVRCLEDIEATCKGRWLTEQFKSLYRDILEESKGEDEVWVTSDVAAALFSIDKIERFEREDSPYFIGVLVESGQSIFITTGE